jgi:FkbM family methyltransferase
VNARLRAFLPPGLNIAATRLVRSVRAARERFVYRTADLQCRLASGLDVSVCCRAEWETFTDIFVAGTYDDAIGAALKRADPTRPLRVVDLGANVGYFTLRVIDLAARQCEPETRLDMVLIEASGLLCTELQARLVPQLPRWVTATVVNGLVGARNGSGELYESAFHIGNTLIPDRFARKSVVRYVDVDELTQSMGTIDLLKCDIEGAEQMFLQSYPSLLQRVQVGVMEVHHSHADARSCYRMLSELGFRLHTSRSNGWFDEVWFDRSGTGSLSQRWS